MSAIITAAITPVQGFLHASALVAALPILVMVFLLGVKRTPAWVAALSGLCAASVIAHFVYDLPVVTILAAISYGAAFGFFPIAWILLWAIMLYRLALETGNFEILKDSIGALTRDRRLQALLIAFGFGAFLEGAAGFGAPVAVAAAMLTGLGFSPFYAAAICLLANTAPVAFGSIGIPIITLAGVTGLPVRSLSCWVGRICAPVSLVIPTYLILVMGGLPALKGVLPAAIVAGIAYAGVQFLVSTLLGPQLTAILSALAAMGSLVVLLKLWKPKDDPTPPNELALSTPTRHSAKQTFVAWLPYILLVLLVFLLGLEAVKEPLDRLTVSFNWPGLHSAAQNMPSAASASPISKALYKLNFMTSSGTACMFATLLAGFFLRATPRQFRKVTEDSTRQLAFPVLTITSVLSFAFLMNFSGATTTLGLAFASTGRVFPFFSPLLGWFGVFLTGSDTSSNALFGNLQAVTAGRLGLDPVLMAAANSGGGVMGKMISLSSIAVAAASSGLPTSDEAKLFRFTLRHSVILATAIGLIVSIYAWLG
jgi:L-lactate transport